MSEKTIPVSVDPKYAISVVEEIELRIKNTESQIEDFLNNGVHDSSHAIADRQKRLRLLR